MDAKMYNTFIDIINRNGVDTTKGSDGWILANIFNEAYLEISKRIEKDREKSDIWKCKDMRVMFFLALENYGVYNPRHVGKTPQPHRYTIANDYELNIPYNNLTRETVFIRNGVQLEESYTNQFGQYIQKDYQIVPTKNGNTKIILNTQGLTEVTLFTDENPLVKVDCDYLRQMIKAKLNTLSFEATIENTLNYLKTNKIPFVEKEDTIKVPGYYYDVCPSVYKPFLSKCEKVCVCTDIDFDQKYRYAAEWGVFVNAMKNLDPNFTYNEATLEDGIVEIEKCDCHSV